MRIFILSLSILVAFPAFSQQDSIKLSPALTLGFDVIQPISSFVNKTKHGLDASIDIGSYKKWTLALEGGYLKINTNNSKLTFNSTGSFGRIGLDYNFYKKAHHGEIDQMNIGFRYGYSGNTFSAPNIIINDTIWGSYYTSLPRQRATAQWFEINFNLRAAVIQNLCFGWSIRAKYMFSNKVTGPIKPFQCPGFGNTSSKVTLGFLYSIYYRIPL
jgi:hypothetical protein